MLRRALAVLLIQATFLALPALACAAFATETVPARKCASAMSCATKRTVLRAGMPCCELSRVETPSAPRRLETSAIAPADVRPRLPPLSPSPIADPAGRSAVPAFRAPLVLRL